MERTIADAVVRQMVPVLQGLDMAIIAAVRSQAELQTEMERLSAELQIVSGGLEQPPDADTVIVRLVAARKRIMALHKKLRTLGDTVSRITAHLQAQQSSSGA